MYSRSLLCIEWCELYWNIRELLDLLIKFTWKCGSCGIPPTFWWFAPVFLHLRKDMKGVLDVSRYKKILCVTYFCGVFLFLVCLFSLSLLPEETRSACMHLSSRFSVYSRTFTWIQWNVGQIYRKFLHSLFFAALDWDLILVAFSDTKKILYYVVTALILRYFRMFVTAAAILELYWKD